MSNSSMIVAERTISSEGLYPVDEYGMPYALLPSQGGKHESLTWEDEDHAFYPRLAPELSDLGGDALRVSRVHEVVRWLHNRKHDVFRFGLERFPKTEEEKYALLVLSCAGYLSRFAVDIARKGLDPKIVYLDRPTYENLRGRQHMHLQTSSNFRIPANGPNPRRTQDLAKLKIGTFLTSYAKRQGLDHIKDESFVDEFLNTEDRLRRYALARIILEEASRVATDSVIPRFREALKDGLIREPVDDPFEVVRKFMYVGSWEVHSRDLANNLAA